MTTATKTTSAAPSARVGEAVTAHLDAVRRREQRLAAAEAAEVAARARLAELRAAAEPEIARLQAELREAERVAVEAEQVRRSVWMRTARACGESLDPPTREAIDRFCSDLDRALYEARDSKHPAGATARCDLLLAALRGVSHLSLVVNPLDEVARLRRELRVPERARN